MSSQIEQVKDQPQMAEGSRAGNNPSGSIDFRGHVTDNKRKAEYPTLYSRGDRVYLKRPRGLEGPYVIVAVYSDGTYDLSENGQVIMDRVKEGALQLA